MSYGIDDVVWSHGPGDRDVLEQLFPSGSVVEIMGSDRLGVVLGNLRMLHPLKEQGCVGPNAWCHQTKGGQPGVFSPKCEYPNCDCETKGDVHKHQGGWRIDVLIGTEKKPMDPWMLSLHSSGSKNLTT